MIRFVNVVKSPESFQQRKKELDDTIDGILKREMKDRGAVTNTIGGTPVNKIQLWAIGDILKHDFGEEDRYRAFRGDPTHEHDCPDLCGCPQGRFTGQADRADARFLMLSCRLSAFANQ